MSAFECIPENLGAEGLNTIATLNRISDTYVGVWDLKQTSSDIPTDAEFLLYKNNHFNSGTSGIDKRQQVADADIIQGGKYRGK